MHPPTLPANHPNTENRKPKTGVLLVNLGTPTEPTAKALRPYLRQFLGDKRVVELPRWLWIPLLYGLIVPLRAPKSAHAYASIWDGKRSMSPLRAITIDQTEALQKRLGKGVMVEHAMRYGQPSIPGALQKLFNQGCTRILLAPLYPQYSAATVGTVVDEAADWLKTLRWQPALRILPPYYDNTTHISALAASVKAHLKTLKTKPQAILASFHGMPLAYCKKGDTYYCHSHKTARLLAEELGTTFHTSPATLPTKPTSAVPPILLTFQSRFGKAEWLKPYTADTLESLPKQGLKNVAVICPAFAADCVETLEEIAIAGKESFLESGGHAREMSYSVIPCLNTSKPGMDMLEALIRNELKGWA